MLSKAWMTWAWDWDWDLDLDLDLGTIAHCTRAGLVFYHNSHLGTQVNVWCTTNSNVCSRLNRQSLSLTALSGSSKEPFGR